MCKQIKSGIVACQGTEGAYSQSACEKIIVNPEIIYVDSFEAVFNAVDKGMCKYGILPLENSLHGSVIEVYDLMREYKFSIIKSAKVEINHALLANNGSFAPNIKEIYSHEQALGQCSAFIKNLKNVEIIRCANTAVAARTVAESGKTDIAAIANPNCSDLYGLSIISKDIQNNSNNCTRFICISKEPENYLQTSEVNKISIMFTLPHKPGSLYEFIGKFADIAVNLTKLESRPIPGSDFEFMFYAELETCSVHSESIADLIKSIENTTLFGIYSEL